MCISGKKSKNPQIFQINQRCCSLQGNVVLYPLNRFGDHIFTGYGIIVKMKEDSEFYASCFPSKLCHCEHYVYLNEKNPNIQKFSKGANAAVICKRRLFSINCRSLDTTFLLVMELLWK